MSQQLFDAFFWITPHRATENTAFQTSKVLWHYPDDVSSIIKNFRNIPQFCFPDLERMNLERVDNSRSENFTFTLTDADGSHIYGICLRGLFRGEGKRYDVSRRPRHCLCIITRFPYFSFFRTILLQVHALALVDDQPGWARYYLDLLFNRAAINNLSSSPTSINSTNSATPTNTAMIPSAITISVIESELPDLFHNLVYSTPRYTGLRISKREVSILPLLETFGVEKFMLLLSAVLCERRILFIAESVDKLSSTILACASMLQPFAWQHIFIPLLPSKLLDYIAAPMPYIIGVRRYLLSKIKQDTLGEVLIVDADSGDIRPIGNITIIDIIGESGSAFKQASESFNIVKAKASGMANILFGKATILDSADDSYNNNGSNGNNSSYVGPKDIITNILSDLRSILNSRPGSNSLQSVASGILRTLPVGSSKSLEELKIQWNMDSEKILRDCLTLLFVYLFACLDDFLSQNIQNVQNIQKTQKSLVKNGNLFDINAFKARRQQLGDSKELQYFVEEFTHSQMFERFCADRQRKIIASNRRTSGFGSNSTASISITISDDDEDLFSIAIAELYAKQGFHNVATIKQIVQSKSSDNGINDKSIGNDFHPLTFKLTSEEISSNLPTSPSSMGPNPESASSPIFYRNVEKICCDAHHNALFLKIMKTITMRLSSAIASSSRGSNGSAGLRALVLLKTLLITGPISVVSYSLDLIPMIRQLIHILEKHQSQQSAVNALEFMAQGSIIDPRPLAYAVLELLLDHQLLLLQRRYVWLQRHKRIPFLLLTSTKLETIKTSLLVPSSSGVGSALRFPKFDKLHSTLKPTLAAIPIFDSSKLRLTTATKAINFERDDDDDVADESDSPSSSKESIPSHPFASISMTPFVPTSSSSSSSAVSTTIKKSNSSNRLSSSPVSVPTLTSPPTISASITSVATTSNKTIPSKSNQIKSISPVVSLLDDDNDIVVEVKPTTSGTTPNSSFGSDPWSQTSSSPSTSTPNFTTFNNNTFVTSKTMTDPFATSSVDFTKPMTANRSFENLPQQINPAFSTQSTNFNSFTPSTGFTPSLSSSQYGSDGNLNSRVWNSTQSFQPTTNNSISQSTHSGYSQSSTQGVGYNTPTNPFPTMQPQQTQSLFQTSTPLMVPFPNQSSRSPMNGIPMTIPSTTPLASSGRTIPHRGTAAAPPRDPFADLNLNIKK